ncbi:MAG: sensor histidine kinase [Chloroflexota bacterium]
MRRRLGRLRWQLTISHLVAILVTLVSMIAAIFLFAGAWIALQTSPAREPANDARIIARSIGGLVEDVNDRDTLNVILRALARGAIRTQLGPGPFAPEPAYRMEGIGPSLRNLSYIAVVDLEGNLIASSDPAGSAFSPPERAEWQPLVRAIRDGERNVSKLTVRRDQGGPVALGAYPIGGTIDGPPWLTNRNTPPEAIVIVGKSAITESTPARAMLRGIVIFGAATVAILGSAFAFALASSAVVGYWLSRQLVRRLEQVGRAAESLASGDLTTRVAESRDDEVGLLARRFNVMADRLTSTVAELDKRTQEAESALATRRELIANVSHELRTPLASISGHAESLLLMGDSASQERKAESLAVLHREARQLSSLVDDLFLLSTTESGGLRLTMRDVDISSVLDEAAARFRPLAKREGQITLLVQVEPDLPPVRGDRERIGQVLGNLVRNALRFTPEGGLVSLRAARQDGCVLVTVADTGAGIPPEQLQRIFERFYRADDARDRASGGAGLGLAIVRELVEAMGGEVYAASVPGEGSQFSFSLLAATAAPRTAPAAPGTPIDAQQKPDIDLTQP